MDNGKCVELSGETDKEEEACQGMGLMLTSYEAYRPTEEKR